MPDDNTSAPDADSPEPVPGGSQPGGSRQAPKQIEKIKPEKEFLKHESKELIKPEKDVIKEKFEKLEKNEFKEHKDAKQEKLEKNERLEKEAQKEKEFGKEALKDFKEGPAEGPGGITDGGDPLTGAGAGQQQHFIPLDQRPDLTRGALKDEPDSPGGNGADKPEQGKHKR